MGLDESSAELYVEHVTPNGPSIRAIREAQRRSLRELAEAAGISAAFLSEIEHGKGASDDAITRLARALDVPTAAITREGTTDVASEDDDIRLYKKEEAAALLGMSVSWVKKKAAARAIPCTYVSGQLRFTRDHIRAITEAGEVVPGSYGRQLAKTA